MSTANTPPVAVVTGGAGGIGVAICEALAAAGFTVVVGYHRSVEAASALAARLPGAGHVALPAPVTDSAALQALAQQLRERFGRADVLVNCAGTTRFVPHADLDQLDDALADQILATNVRGPFAATRALLPLLKTSTLPGGGVVLNISSIAAHTAMGSNVLYCASKAALDNMTRSLARALAPAVRVLSVSPGLVDTDFVKSMDPRWREEQAARTPLGRLAAPAEVGRAVVVAVRDMTFSTGTVLAVDGGRPLA
ncbi:SDR family NAD(P)-dependent oxidoreductase [Aquabacterium sp.]|uniref:SDR family NAD(P)-dependent oxidoreductase n=1 Tax=Aquabacterium sp. TaxID=1872578 RepID=UPI002BA3D1BD|nr:SDR family oxidoreductase [Aquabacterium sp.]HSW04379.1 SDR family oxidoreductase [Aquabacterium sp.]